MITIHLSMPVCQKRYTKARINRTLIFMLTNIKQASLDNLPKIK